jgi:putative Mn2+ efflux pump MntP
MEIIYALCIAFALGIDAFSVAVGAGAYLGKADKRQKFRLSFHFGLFQFFMPLIGWFAGAKIASMIADFDHWLVLIILSLVGGKMVYEALKHEDEEAQDTDVTRGWTLVVLSFATSIDALAVGFSLALMKQPIMLNSIIIGIVAAAMTLIGIYIGEKASDKFGKKAELVGGIVLILIGLKVCLEHTHIINF